ncbi:putative motility protein [Cohnella boryungensis]|uniref:Motility protein n=1 Tax=Cohnella boryungensis TaxID=768479 RepID=A0ABV8S5H0_9BACL
MSSISGIGAISAASLRQQISIAVLSNSLDIVQQQGQQMVQALQTSIPSNVGQQLDVKV